MALTDMKEALLNNSYDYDATDKTLTDTWENSYSYLLALEQAYIKYEYFETYSGNDPDDPTKLDWGSTRDRKVIGHMYLDKFNNVNVDIDYDIIHLNKREAYRSSIYYQKKFTMDDIMFRSDIFRYMPVVFIDDKIQWDYSMTVTEEGTNFTTMFDRSFIIEQEREWDPEKQEYSDIIYKTHKLQVIIIDTKYAWRFKSTYAQKAYPNNGNAYTASDGPFKIISNNGEVRFKPSSSKVFEEESILTTWKGRFDDSVAQRRISAYWQKPLNGLDAPAAIDNVRFEAIDKKMGAYVKTTSTDGYPEFFVEKYAKNPDGTTYNYMETISGSDMITMLYNEAKSNIHYPYLALNGEDNINGHKVLDKDGGTLFFALQFPNDYGKEWWNNGTTLYPMDYDYYEDEYVGKLSNTDFQKMKENPNQDFFIIFIYINELHRQKLPYCNFSTGNVERSYTVHDLYVGDYKSFPFFEVGQEVVNNDGKNVYELFNMPIPTTNFIVIIRSYSETQPPLLYRSEDLIDLHYPNFYTWKNDKVDELLTNLGFTYGDATVEVYYFYHEDIDHKCNDMFWFYRKYLYEAYKATYNASEVDYYEDKLLYEFNLRPDIYYPVGALDIEDIDQFIALYRLLMIDYEFKKYSYGETDYIHDWLKEHPDSNPEDYKIKKLKEWVTWDPETLHKYVRMQNKLSNNYGLYCSTISMPARARTDTFREMADRDYEYVFIEHDGYNQNTIAYEAVQNASGQWEYKLIDGEKVEVIPDTDTVYIDCGTATIPTKMYRWTGVALPGRVPQYVYVASIRYFTDDEGNPETRYVFSMNNTRPYPLLLEARIFVNGLMCVDVYQERKLFLDYFYIPSKYFTINPDGTCNDFIEIEIFPTFEITKNVHFDSAVDEKTFMLFEPTDGNYYTKIDSNARQDSKSVPIYEKIEHSEEVYIKPVTPDYSMKDTEGNLYTMTSEAVYNGKSEHLGDFEFYSYEQVIELRNTLYDEEREVIVGYEEDGTPITEMRTVQVPDNVYISEIAHVYVVTSPIGSFIKNITHEEFVELRDSGELTPYNTASWKQLTEAYYHRETVVDSEGHYSYIYSDPVFPSEDTIYKELASEKPYKWYFWDGFRFIYYDESRASQNVFPTVMDAYFRDTYPDDPSLYQYNTRFNILSEATVTEIYDDGEYNVVDRDTTKEPHQFTRLTKFKVKPKDVYSNLINRDVVFCIHKRPISYEIEVDNQDGKSIAYIMLEIRDKNFNYSSDYIRIYANGRLLSPTNWKLVYTFNAPRIYIMTPVAYEDRIFIDITPFRYKHVFHKEEIDPLNEIINLKGYITKPFDTRYYDIYLNGRKLNYNNVYTIDPWSITLTNMKSKYDLDIFEKERDWEYYGVDYNTTIYTYTLDDLLATGMVPDSIKYKIVVDYINDHKDDRYIITPNVDKEERWYSDIDFTKWAEMEIFYYNELLPKSYMNPDRLQFNNIVMDNDYTYVSDTYTIDPREDTTDPDQRERRANHPDVVMLNPDLILEHPSSVPYPTDPTLPHTMIFAVGHMDGVVDQRYLEQDISDKLKYDSNI